MGKGGFETAVCFVLPTKNYTDCLPGTCLTTLMPTPTLSLASSTLLFVNATLETGAAVDVANGATVDAAVGAEKTLLGPESSIEVSSKLGTLTFWKIETKQK